MAGNHRPIGDAAMSIISSALFAPPAWYADASCAQTDPELFFPGKGGSPKAAKRICARCPVAAQCLEYALENDEAFGVWGGTTENQRRGMRRNTTHLRVVDDAPARRRRANAPECGTEAGAQAHRRRAEKPCPKCLQRAALENTPCRERRERNAK